MEEEKKYTEKEVREIFERALTLVGPCSEKVLKDDGPVQHEAKCSKCGVDTTVPFKPSKNYPIYCRECYAAKQQGR